MRRSSRHAELPAERHRRKRLRRQLQRPRRRRLLVHERRVDQAVLPRAREPDGRRRSGRLVRRELEGDGQLRAARRGLSDLERPVPRSIAALCRRHLRPGRLQLRRQGREPDRRQLRLPDSVDRVPDRACDDRPLPAAQRAAARDQRRVLVLGPCRRGHGDQLAMDPDRRRLRQHPSAPDVRDVPDRGRHRQRRSGPRTTCSAPTPRSTGSWRAPPR